MVQSDMKKFAFRPALAAAVFAFGAATCAILAGGIVSADIAAAAEKKVDANGKPLRGVVRPARRVGGYSYKYTESLNTRRFVDPSMQTQSSGGPFDSGFFFSSPVGPHGGDSPYLQ